MKFKSKNDFSFHFTLVTFAIMIIFFIIFCFLEFNMYILLITIGLCVIFALFASIYFNTYYEFNPDHLKIVNGVFPTIKVKYNDILTIYGVGDLLTCDQIRIKKLELIYKKDKQSKRGKSVFVTPDDQKAFISELFKHNEEIQIKITPKKKY